MKHGEMLGGESCHAQSQAASASDTLRALPREEKPRAPVPITSHENSDPPPHRVARTLQKRKKRSENTPQKRAKTALSSPILEIFYSAISCIIMKSIRF